ncbi:hypothetical protein FA95DRAFT_1556314 [Auriscalpium vulgare]|uniref:Uncharacterized protein n=1 Tax=Auriscalpium vulgare TaxID=40419 RepID=A0ACB8S1H2_9AGAM|nr:hypothetical protein FA95DRAFT_1556314 [Auriscalpium vulgare]
MSNSSAPLPTVTVNVRHSHTSFIKLHTYPETEHEFESDSDDTVDDATADSPRNEAVNSRTVDMSKVFNTLDETTATMRDLSERLRVYCERRREKMLAEQNRATTDVHALHSLSKCTDQLSEVEKFAQQQGGH